MPRYEFEQDGEPSRRERKTGVHNTSSLVAQRAAETGTTEPLDAGAVMHLQRTAGNANVGALLEEDDGRSPVLDVVGSGGTPLAEPLRTDMEARFGESFSDVRVHTDAEAASSAASVQAKAFTVDNHVVLGAQAPQLDTNEGQHTLAHELTHVVQQRSGTVAGTDAGGGIKVSSPTDPFELAAERNADRVMSGKQTEAPAAAAPALQREELAPDEELLEEEEPTAMREMTAMGEDEDEEEEVGS